MNMQVVSGAVKNVRYVDVLGRTKYSILTQYSLCSGHREFTFARGTSPSSTVEAEVVCHRCGK
jgi:hypothetical protein